MNYPAALQAHSQSSRAIQGPTLAATSITLPNLKYMNPQKEESEVILNYRLFRNVNSR